MRTTPLEDALRNEPFRAFEIHTDGRRIPVGHPEQILLTPDKSTAVVVGPDDHIAIIDVDRISSLTLRKRNFRKV